MAEHRKTEQFRVSGKQLVAKVKELIHEGNARRIIIKNEAGHTLLEIPVTLAAVSTLLAPWLAAVAAVAALVTECTIIVEKRDE